MEVAVETLTKRYARFSGRATRHEYWAYLFVFLCLALVQGIVDGVIHHPAEPYVYGAFALALVAPGLALACRRLHDIDRSGAWLLVGLIPVAGQLLLLWWFLQPGTEGANRFGLDPRAPAGGAAFAG